MSRLLGVTKLVVKYGTQDSPTLKGVSLDLHAGEKLALVGESGSGKSTLAKALLGLAPVIDGKIAWNLSDSNYRKRVQMVFQDPYNSLHPRLTVNQNLFEPLKIHRCFDPLKSPHAAAAMLERVGLDPAQGTRYPHEFSGGQLQRICIARALLSEPQIILADEPVSALDVSVQAQVINLLSELSEERGLALLFISHDLAVVRQLCDRVCVMFAGRLVECGSVEEVCFGSRHPYTQTLIRATRGQKVLSPELSLAAPEGCPYFFRCIRREERCKQDSPPLVENSLGHICACYYPKSLSE